jgi:hypothetical protein
MASDRTLGQKIMNAAAIISAVIAIEGALSWAFKDKIDAYIKSISDESRSTRQDLSEEMEVRKELVVIEIGKMYKEFKETQKNLEKFNQTWIPYLEDETKIIRPGVYVLRSDDNEIWWVDYDGKEYRVHFDDQGIGYYVADGYRYNIWQ